MPRGPEGEKRPADVIGNVVKVMRIAVGEETDDSSDDGKNMATQELGKLGGAARAKSMTAKCRKEIAFLVDKESARFLGAVLADHLKLFQSTTLPGKLDVEPLNPKV